MPILNEHRLTLTEQPQGEFELSDLARQFRLFYMPGIWGRRSLTDGTNLSGDGGDRVALTRGWATPYTSNSVNISTPAVLSASYPLVLAWSGQFINGSNTWVPIDVPGLGGGSGDENAFRLESGTVVGARIRNGFGSVATPQVTVPGGTTVGVDLIVILQSLSASDHRLYVNGVQANSTTNVGSISSAKTTGFLQRGSLALANHRTYWAAFGNRAIPDSVALELTGSGQGQWARLFEPQRIWIPVTSAASGYTLTAQTGDFALTGVSVGLNRGFVASAQVGDFSLTGNSVGLNRGYVATAQTGDFTLTGVSVSLNRGFVAAAQTGAFTLTGNDAVLTLAASGAYSLTAQTGAFAVTGNDAVLTYTPLNAYTLTGLTGSFALTGSDAGLTYTPLNAYTLTAESGSFGLTGRDADLIYSGQAATTKRGMPWMDGFTRAKKRLALQRVLEYLTKPEPSEETRIIVRRIKAGKTVQRDEKPPVVMAEVSAEKIADKLIPSRVAAVQAIPDLELQAVVKKAIRLAQERDDEDVLLLL